MRGFPRTTSFTIRLLGCSVGLCVLPALLSSADPLQAPSNGPAIQSEKPQSGDQAPAAVAELLSLIEQLDPLRVTIPYIDHHDEAVAAQTDLQRRRRQAGLLTRTNTAKDYNQRKGWSERSGSSRSRDLSSDR